MRRIPCGEVCLEGWWTDGWASNANRVEARLVKVRPKDYESEDDREIRGLDAYDTQHQSLQWEGGDENWVFHHYTGDEAVGRRAAS